MSGTSNILNQPKGLTAQIPTPNSSSMKTISFYDHLFLKIIQNKNPEILYILICSGWISKISQNLDDVFFFYHRHRKFNRNSFRSISVRIRVTSLIIYTFLSCICLSLWKTAFSWHGLCVFSKVNFFFYTISAASYISQTINGHDVTCWHNVTLCTLWYYLFGTTGSLYTLWDSSEL